VNTIPRVEELTPAPEAWEAFQKLAHLPKALFLDSARYDPLLGRYSFITADPFEFVTSSQGHWSTTVSAFPASSGLGLFEYLQKRIAGWQTEPLPGLPPFQGGTAGLFSYGLCHHFESLPRTKWDEFRLPDLAVGFYDWVLSFDHRDQRAWILSHGLPEDGRADRSREAESRIAAIKGLLGASSSQCSAAHEAASPRLPIQELAPQYAAPGPEGLTSNFCREEYLRAVSRTIDYIYAGDIFQANLSQRMLFPAHDQPLQLYERLRTRNAATFGALFDCDDFVILSASPERFLRVDGGEVETRPIKGTRPKEDDAEGDRRQREELYNSVKDRAENLMIVDLLRNDLSRVCRPGTVHVKELFKVETSEFVHHLVSEIRGCLEDGNGPLDLLQATFPGGSVTGAPKVRAMEIIAELEPTVRGPYCGCLGYLGFDGSMDMNILIRTITCAQGWLQFPVGGGIVSQSDPEKEYDETLHKAEGLIRSLV